MRCIKTSVTALALAAMLLVAGTARGDEAASLERIDENLRTAAGYLDVIRDNELAAPQYIAKKAGVLVTLAGQRNDLVAQECQAAAWRERHADRTAAHDAAAAARTRARHRLSASDAAKTLGYLRRMRAALKAVDGRLADAEAQRARAYEQLAATTDGLVAELAGVLRDNGYDSELDDNVPASRADFEGPRFNPSHVTRIAGVLRKMHALLAGIHERMQDARGLHTKAHEQMAASAPQFGRAVEAILGQGHGDAQS